MKNNNVVLYALFILIYLVANPVSLFANEGVDEDNVKVLEETKKELALSEERRIRLNKSIEKMEKELADLSQKTSEGAREMQDYELKINNIEKRILSLEESRNLKNSAIALRKDQMSSLLGVMIKMSKAPAESVLVMPSGIKGKIKAARSLGLITGNMKVEMELLSKEISDMNNIRHKITKDQKLLESSKNKLADKRKILEGQINERKKLVRKLHSETLQEQKRIANLVKKSKSLESLMGALEEQREKGFEQRFSHIGIPILRPDRKISPEDAIMYKKEEEEYFAYVRSKNSNGKKDRDFVKSKGNISFPVVGKIVGRYGYKRSENNTLKGMEIETSTKARVISPFDGEVVFVGPFLDYGRIVIIRHSHQYHTLLAGFEQIDVDSGQFLLEGEPIGVMGDKSSSLTLYMELRKDGKATDPRPWLASYPSRFARN